MNKEPRSVYEFSTFQELLDRVPGKHIAQIMEDIGKSLASVKQAAEKAGVPSGGICIKEPFIIDTGRTGKTLNIGDDEFSRP